MATSIQIVGISSFLTLLARLNRCSHLPFRTWHRQSSHSSRPQFWSRHQHLLPPRLKSRILLTRHRHQNPQTTRQLRTLVNPFPTSTTRTPKTTLIFLITSGTTVLEVSVLIDITVFLSGKEILIQDPSGGPISLQFSRIQISLLVSIQFFQSHQTHPIPLRSQVLLFLESSNPRYSGG